MKLSTARVLLGVGAAVSIAVAGGVATASPSVATGSCGASYSTSVPKTLKCSFLMTATSTHYVVNGVATRGAVLMRGTTTAGTAPLQPPVDCAAVHERASATDAGCPA